MSEATLQPLIHAGEGRTLTRAEFLSLINTYNWFLKDQTQLHLTYTQDRDGQVTVEGFLNISWGVTRPIRLQIQNDKQTLPLIPLVPQVPLVQIAPCSPISPLGDKRGMTRWGEYSDLHQIDETQETVISNATPPAPVPYETTTLRPQRQKHSEQEAESNLFRCMSDASLVKMRRKGKSAAQREKERQHRFSINGHFYNYKPLQPPSPGRTASKSGSERMGKAASCGTELRNSVPSLNLKFRFGDNALSFVELF
uniref:Ras association domain-containing protein 6 n=1 Tax=Knipowitschia caucasica TaxID=637954 RepID=A0AAV2IWY5_KNICA